jgi:hypothetical protein
MRQHRATVLGIGLLVSVSLAGCVGDSTKSASNTPASTPIASVGSEPGPPVVEGQPSPPPEAGEVQARGVAFAAWQITNSGIGEDFAAWAAMPGVQPLTGDFNGDGRTDVALLRQSPGWLSMPVAFANADGTWHVTNGVIGDFAGWATEGKPLTGDFNGDGRTDVALLKRSAGWTTMPVAFATGDGTWRITNSGIGDFAGWAATPGAQALTGDFNGDKRTDVVLLNTAAGWTTMPVAFATGDGTWRITNSSSGAFAGWTATPGREWLTGDFNGDGRTDVALLFRLEVLNRRAGWNRMPVAFATGDGTWRITNSDIGEFAVWARGFGVQVLTGDFNGDKRTDVALLNRSVGWGSMPVAFATGDGTWRITNSSSGDFAGWATGNSVYELTGDFDGDGRTDVALLKRSAGWTTMPVAFATGDGTWRITNSSSGGFAGWAATTIVGDRFGNKHSSTSVTNNTAAVFTGDFDGDKRTDVALLNTSKDVGWLSMPVAFWHDVLLPQTTIPKSSATGLGYILPRGVEGEPATPAPTEENNTTPAPK